MLNTHPAVAEAVVVGVGPRCRARSGQGRGRSSDEMRRARADRLLPERLANYKVPQVVEFRDEIPKSPLGKILRKYLV